MANRDPATEPPASNENEKIHKVGALLGLLTLAGIWAFEVVGPALVAGLEPSGARDRALVEAYFAHAALTPLAVLACLAAFSFAGFVLALRHALPGGPIARYLGTLGWGLALVEVAAALSKNALRVSMVGAVGSGADPLPAFLFYDAFWNSAVYLLEGAILLTLSLAFLRARWVPSWGAKFGLVTGAVQVGNAAVLPLGLSATAALPGNLMFSVWFVIVSWCLFRAGRVARNDAGAPEDTPVGPAD